MNETPEEIQKVVEQTAAWVPRRSPRYYSTSRQAFSGTGVPVSAPPRSRRDWDIEDGPRLAPLARI